MRSIETIEYLSHFSKASVTNSIVSIKESGLLYKKYKISKSQNDLFIYKMNKNITISLVREAKKKYYSNMLKNCSDTKNT